MYKPFFSFPFFCDSDNMTVSPKGKEEEKQQQAEDYVLPPEPLSPPWKTPKCLGLPLHIKTSAYTRGWLGRGREEAVEIKKKKRNRATERREFLSTWNVPQPGSNGLTKILMRLPQKLMAIWDLTNLRKKEACNWWQRPHWMGAPSSSFIGCFD